MTAITKPLSKPSAEPQLAESLYETDFFHWTEEQARLLTTRRAEDLDWDNLAEEILSLGGSEKREISSRLMRLLQHLLKWQYQSERRAESWLSTISGQRIHLEGIKEASPSLASYPATVFGKAYVRARREAARETHLPLRTFPAESPYTVEDVLSPDFFPGPPWSPEDLIRD
jgi:hypothetical protein